MLWEWSALDHVGVGETYTNIPKQAGVVSDYFHINSIDELADGNLLVSARNTWALYEIDRTTGDDRLAARRPPQRLRDGRRARASPGSTTRASTADGTITLFDNESMPKIGDATRLLTLDVDQAQRTVRVQRALTHPRHLLAGAEGNAQLLDDGGMFSGWGLGRTVTEQSPDGELRFEAKLPANADTYRGYTLGLGPAADRAAGRRGRARRLAGDRLRELERRRRRALGAARGPVRPMR